MTYILLSLTALSALACLALWRQGRRNARKVGFLLDAIDNGDYTFRFREGQDRDGQLNTLLNRIKAILQHARDAQKAQEKYYELILDSVDTGILVADEERGLVLQSNQAARRLLRRDCVTHLSQVEQQLKAFSTRVSHTALKGRKVEIIGFSDIHGELADQEVDAWVKLIRVLTHEIMNAITPIISLSEESPTSSSERLRIIHRTSKELMDFVQGYRQFTHVPTPAPCLFYVKPFLERMAQLAKPLLTATQTLTILVEPKDLLVYADESLTSRVVGNLLKNAAEAIGPEGRITLHAFTGEHDTVTLDVSDDGPAIPADVAAHVFIPFFTTKPQGSGVGLSISRQIMRTMGGGIELLGQVTEGQTTFRITFA